MATRAEQREDFDKKTAERAGLIKFPTLVRLQQSGLKEDIVKVLQNSSAVTNEALADRIMLLLASQQSDFAKYIGSRFGEILNELNASTTAYRRLIGTQFLDDLLGEAKLPAIKDIDE